MRADVDVGADDAVPSRRCPTPATGFPPDGNAEARLHAVAGREVALHEDARLRLVEAMGPHAGRDVGHDQLGSPRSRYCARHLRTFAHIIGSDYPNASGSGVLTQRPRIT